jgi:hypothetical protein
MTINKETKIRFLGYMADRVMYIDPTNEYYKLEVHDEKTGVYSTVKIDIERVTSHVVSILR